MSEHMSEDDYTALIGAIKRATLHDGVPCLVGGSSERHRIAVRIAKSIRDLFVLTRKPAPLPDAPGSIIRIPVDDQRLCRYILGADGAWHLAAVRWRADEMEERAAQGGFEVVA